MRHLLVINRSAGTRLGKGAIDQLRALAESSIQPGDELQLEVATDHPEVAAATERFLLNSTSPATIIAGGGGGTLRAAIESVCRAFADSELPDADRLRIAALRMGSGNVIAKQFGAPRDPANALKGILANARADRTVPCCIMKAVIGSSGEDVRATHYAVTLGGFGQFGRIPGDLARWHRRFPRIHRAAAKLLGVERLTDLEYATTLAVRVLWCACRPAAAEQVEIETGGSSERMKLLAGVLMNFPIRAIRIDPGVSISDPAITLSLLPQTGRLSGFALRPRVAAAARARKFVITRQTPLRLRLTDRTSAEFFLDEDPLTLEGEVELTVAGTLAFVPGPEYQWPNAESGAT